jgi:hypothetical protein
LDFDRDKDYINEHGGLTRSFMKTWFRKVI